MNDAIPVTRAILKEELSKELRKELSRFATKADLAEAVAQMATKDELAAAFANMATKADLARIDERFDRVNDSIDRVLSVVVNMHNSLAPMVKDHERRIKRLEKEAGVA